MAAPVALVLATLMLAPGLSGVVAQDVDPCVSHPPIRIVGDSGEEGFVLEEGTPTYRPLSGVLGGSGTEEDPYLIENWCIVIRHEEVGVWLQQTSAHVVIRDNVFVAAGTLTTYTEGVKLEDSRNVRIESNTMLRLATGFHLIDAPDNEVVENHISDGTRQGGRVADSPRVLVQDNVFENNRWRALFFRYSNDARVEGNVISGHENEGVWNDGSRRMLIVDNTIRNTDGWGVAIGRADDVEVRDNVLENNDGGVVAGSNAQGTVVKDNNIQGNGIGVKAGSGTQVDGRFNWWGCSSGPTHWSCDSFTGDVDYSPWLASQKLDAGA